MPETDLLAEPAPARIELPASGQENQLIHFTRTTSIAPGKVAEALAFAGEMTEYLSSSYGQKMQLMMPVGGNPHRLCFYSSYDSLGDMEKFQTRTMGDAKYLSILGKGAGIFIAGSVHDDIWKTV